MSKSKINYIFIGIFLLGLGLRCWGLFSAGTRDMSDAFLPWGKAVLEHSLAGGFKGIYFPITYLFFAFCAWIIQFIPKLWFLPFKATNLVFELCILWVFLKLAPKHRVWVWGLYWLNPLLILLGGWQGFWDALMVLLLLLSALVFDQNRIKYSEFVSGFLIGLALMVKPQVQALVLAGLIFIFIKSLSRSNFRPLIKYGFGFSIPFLVFSLYFFANGKPIYYLAFSLTDARNILPVLVASEANIWYTISRIIQILISQTGPVYTLRLSKDHFTEVFYLSVGAMMILLFFLARIKRTTLLDMYTLAAILLPQIVVMSHVNHFITASILLIIYVIHYSEFRIPWIISMMIHFYSAFVRYTWGNIPLFSNIDKGYALTILSAVQFIFTCLLIKSLFRLAHSKHNLIS